MASQPYWASLRQALFWGCPVLGLVDPKEHTLHLLSELGVVILLFAIGLETDLKVRLRSDQHPWRSHSSESFYPSRFGYGACRLLELSNLVAVVAGATLTATSVGITARVLSDLNRLTRTRKPNHSGAAVIDDVVGLVILAVVAGIARGEGISLGGVAQITLSAFGFLAVTLLVGRLIVPAVINWMSKIDLPGTPTMLALILAFGRSLGWRITRVPPQSSAPFAAGLLVREARYAHEIERGSQLGHFFVPLFFVVVGAAVDL